MARNDNKVSRRDFARSAALLTVAAPLAATPAVVGGDDSRFTEQENPPKLPPDFPKLSDQSRAEVEERYQTILKQYGGRFTDEQKTDLRRLCFLAQPPLDHLRNYTLKNGDSPALYLKPLVEREKKPGKAVSTAGAKKTPEAAR